MTASVLAALLIAAPVPKAPAESSDVVTLSVEQPGLAEGLSFFYFKVTIADGWEVLIDSDEPGEADVPLTTAVITEGKADIGAFFQVEAKNRVERQDRFGVKYMVCTETVIVHTSTNYPAKDDVTVTVKVRARNANRTLKESTLTKITRD